MQLIVRTATEEDIPAVVALGKNFIAGSQYAQLVNPDSSAMADTVERLIRNHVVFVLEVECGPPVGMLGMALYPHLVTGQRTAVECFWWVEPGFRGNGVSMLRQAERWARDHGAEMIQMIQPHDEERLGAVYEHLGYTVTEHQYQKALGGAKWPSEQQQQSDSQ